MHHKLAWAFVYLTLLLAGLYIAGWLASGPSIGTSEPVEERCLTRPRKPLVECGELEP